MATRRCRNAKGRFKKCGSGGSSSSSRKRCRKVRIKGHLRTVCKRKRRS